MCLQDEIVKTKLNITSVRNKQRNTLQLGERRRRWQHCCVGDEDAGKKDTAPNRRYLAYTYPESSTKWTNMYLKKLLDLNV